MQESDSQSNVAALRFRHSLKALVVAPQPFFSPRGTPFSVYYRALVMAELGVELDILTYGEGQDVEIPGVRIVRIPSFGFLGSVRVGPSALKAFLDAVLVVYLLILLARHRYDFVHAHEEAVFACLPLKRVFRFKLLYDMHSSLPRQLTSFRFTTSRLLIGAFSRLERASLRGSDAVITICPALAENALREVDDPAKHFLIENSIFDPVKLRSAPGSSGSEPAAMDSGIAKPRLPVGRPLVVYAGTLESYQGIDLLLRAFQRVSRVLSDSHLLIVGGNPTQVERYSALAEELGISASSHFTGSVQPEVARTYSARADVLVSPRTAGTSTPLKIYEQLASGVPLVATRIDAHTQVLDEAAAFLADPTPDALAEAIVRAVRDEGDRVARVQAAQALYRKRYSRAVYVSKIEALLKKLT